MKAKVKVRVLYKFVAVIILLILVIFFAYAQWGDNQNFSTFYASISGPQSQFGLGDSVPNEHLFKPRPNILLIVADDLGYADLGVYGSQIQTPNIDSLAASGMLFTQFHTAPLCAPTRAMLMSGNNNHVAGVAKQSRSRGLAGVSFEGYETGLSDRIMPLPRLLKKSGYHTYSVGKWHLGLELEQSPHAAGFSRSYNLLNGSGSHFDARGINKRGSSYRMDEKLVEYPIGRYSTEVYTDQLIAFIDENKDDGKPFLAFAAYTAPHWPLQVPDEYLDLYAGFYDDGYDSLRERRLESLKQAHIISADSELPPRNDAITPWGDLTPDEQRKESRKMELYAAMVDNLDDHIGRLIEYLKDQGLYDNTLIVFMSDNGAAAEDFYHFGPHADYVQSNFNNSYEKMGTAESFVSYGPQWAEAGSAPFQRRKGYTREGGLTAPLIIAGAGVAVSGVINKNYLTVMDLAPTFIELAGARYPDDRSVKPILGESINSLFTGESDSVHDDQYVTVGYHSGRTYLRQGKWKISTLEPPFDEKFFELHDLSVDPGEARNLAEIKPEKLGELTKLWQKHRRELGIVLPEDL